MTNHQSGNFAPFEERMRREGLPEIVIDNFRYYYNNVVAGNEGLIHEDAIEPVTSVPGMDEMGAFAAAGRAAIRHAAVLKLNGGLGTSMGLDKAKSLLVARDGLTFLDIIARQTVALSERYDQPVPLILMNSFNTDADSRAVLAQYPALQHDLPLTMMQHKVPKVLQDTLAPAEWPAQPSLEWCPPGHGEVYIALATSGMLQALLKRGIEYLFISNADNLGATLDTGILGYVAQQQVPFLMEVTDRTEADKKGGHLARRKDGQLVLREVAQCPEEDLAAFQDITRHKYFNTNNIWVNLRQLKQLLEEHNNVLKLPMIRNAKTVDPRDSGSPAVFQLETAMGAAIAVFPGAQAVRVTRERFMPVKLCSDLLALRSDVYVLDEDFCIHTNPERQRGPITIGLDNKYYKLIADFEQRFPYTPSLIDCAAVSVQGDVVFDQDIILQGHVRIVNRSGTQRHVPASATMRDDTYDVSA
ncbi:MAG TPA: UTP--glucose-1-phosphate uridylyltransferase [Roseiflexaceae bacterium]|nr:UTP--glucose-1-phosphate uridylyltransferase [Roseiflexaceae bacterium]